MKNIEPIQIWKDGQNKTASVLDARIVYDDLTSYCTFYWQLKEADSTEIVPSPVEGGESTTIVVPGQLLSEGNSTMTGDDYLEWDGSNDAAYEFVASQINVVISTSI